MRPPGSKSFTNRGLVLAALAEGRSTLIGALDAEDALLMRGCLDTLGVRVVAEDEGTTLHVEGAGGPLIVQGVPQLHVGLAGTVARFLTAVLAASPGEVVVDGVPRMRERPMKMLIEALREQGAAIACTGIEGALPVRIGPHAKPLRGGEVVLERPASSQFISALIIAATLAARPTAIVLRRGTPARPYVDMTIDALHAFGGDARWSADDTITVQPGRLSATRYVVEPDASGASYFLALAAIHGGRVVIDGIGRHSRQGDAAFAEVLGRLGATVEQGPASTTVTGTGRLRGGDFDLSDMPDMTLTLAVVAAHATGPTTIGGVSILRHHESDRLAAIATELRKLGAEVTEHDDGVTVTPPPAGLRQGVLVDSHGDHRMAMALSLVGDIVVGDPACVAKTYPRYFDELRNLGMVSSDG